MAFQGRVNAPAGALASVGAIERAALLLGGPPRNIRHRSAARSPARQRGKCRFQVILLAWAGRWSPP